jgi:DNA-binding LacI/PurR family transcriptional regulator
MSEFIQNRRNAINSLIKSYTPDAIVTESLARLDLLVEAIEMEGFKVPEDLMIASSHEMHPGITYIKYDYADFSKKAFELIESIMDDPDKKFGRKTLSGLIKSISLTIDPE